MFRSIALSIASALFSAAVVYYFWRAFQGILDSGFGWTSSLVTTQLLVIIPAALAGIFAFGIKLPKKWMRILLALIVPAGLLTYHFVNHTPYVEDYMDSGETLAADVLADHELEKLITEARADFHGLVAIASPGCGYCQQAARKLEKIQQRGAASDILVLMYSSDSSSIDYFIEKSGADQLDYLLTPDSDGTLEMARGHFPTFAYFKDGQFTHRWSNNQFGYPTIDRIEEGI